MTRVYIPRALRERIAEQARHRCGYCLTPAALIGAPLEIEHLIPVSLGGLTEEDNLWLACSLCNGHKGAGLQPAIHSPERSCRSSIRGGSRGLSISPGQPPGIRSLV